ncbi:MAG: ATP-dependent helicase HrpB [Desulfobulbus sp.]
MPTSPFSSIPELPICSILPELKTALAHGSAVLAAPPGSGKTTVVPLALASEPWLKGKRILILEPRRLATRAAAKRMAALLGEPVGQRVGYQIRFDRCSSTQTRIEVVTEGILTRRLQQNAGLDDVGLIIFDEFHERSLHADLALALCLDLCQIREDLRLLVMSATLDAEPIARLLGDVPVISGQGQMFAVEITYLERPARGRIAEVVSSGVKRILPEVGDMLVFLPGSREIRETLHLLQLDPLFADWLILPLLGELSSPEQDRAIFPDPEGRRRIILATTIAETSLTIEGIRCVVDSGWSRLPAFDPATGLNRLNTVRVSKATADQRTGRAGRLGPGHCLRLWTRDEHHNLPPFHPPEIIHADLAPLALELALWGVSDPKILSWLDPPRAGSYDQACELLRGLEAIDRQGRITPLGKKLTELPLHPRLGHMLLAARDKGLTSLGCDLAALLSERDPFRGREESCDITERLQLLATWRSQGDQAARGRGGDPTLLRRIDQAAQQWRRSTTDAGAWQTEDIGSLLIAAYPERIARKRPGQRERYQLANGRGVRLLPTDRLNGEEYLVAAQVDSGQSEGRIFLAAPVDLNTIRKQHPQLLRFEEQVRWDGENGRVVATAQTRLGALVVEEQPLTDIPRESITQALLRGIHQSGLAILPWTRQARQLQARLINLRCWQPEGDWPDLDDQALLADLSWLAPFIGGMNRLEQMQGLDLYSILLTPLDWPKRKVLEDLAPETITVPSGSKIRIEYRPGEPPLLAVRLQEMFGLKKTPTLCRGRVALLLHLLSPARRPIQVTTDLESFWKNGYPEVKKELKGRYPKHAWPDDPLVAKPIRGLPRKRSAS